MTDRPTDTVLTRIPVKGQQELHVRLRQTEDLPDWLDLAQYNVADKIYRQAAPFPDRPEVIEALIQALQNRLDQHRQAGGEG